jgi:hypothetical protein
MVKIRRFTVISSTFPNIWSVTDVVENHFLGGWRGGGNVFKHITVILGCQSITPEKVRVILLILRVVGCGEEGVPEKCKSK